MQNIYDSLLANAGLEVGYQQFLFLRGGYRFLHDTDTFAAGFGLNYLGMRFDYAYLANALVAKHLISLGYQFIKRQAAENKPAQVNSETANAILLYRQGHLEEAKKSWQKTLKSSPNDPYAREYLTYFNKIKASRIQEKLHSAELLIAQGDYPAAAQIWNEILAEDPENSDAKRALAQQRQASDKAVGQARSAANQEQWAMAMQFLQQALNIIPDYAPALALRAEVQAKVSQGASQQSKLEKATRAEALRLIKSGETKAALQLVNNSSASAPSSSALLQLKEEIVRAVHNKALEFKSNKHFQKSLKIWKDIQELAPDFMPAKDAYQETQKYYKATILPIKEKALEAYQQKNYSTAIEFYGKAADLASEEEIDQFRAKAHEAQGILDYRSDHIKQALEHWQEAKKLNPQMKKIDKYLERAKNKITFLKNLGWEVKE
jgi:tetratricopeptide (TPR) repeat protein